MNIFQPRNLLACERDDDVSDDDARFVCRALWFDFEDDRGSFFFALQRLAKRVRQTNRLHADTEISAAQAPHMPVPAVSAVCWSGT